MGKKSKRPNRMSRKADVKTTQASETPINSHPQYDLTDANYARILKDLGDPFRPLAVPPHVAQALEEQSGPKVDSHDGGLMTPVFTLTESEWSELEQKWQVEAMPTDKEGSVAHNFSHPQSIQTNQLHPLSDAIFHRIISERARQQIESVLAVESQANATRREYTIREKSVWDIGYSMLKELYVSHWRCPEAKIEAELEQVSSQLGQTRPIIEGEPIFGPNATLKTKINALHCFFKECRETLDG